MPRASEASPPLVSESRAGGVLTITLNRPDTLNALSSAMLDALHGALQRAGADEQVRVVVLAGAGRAFSAGHDLKEMRAHDDEAFQRALFARCSEVMLAIQALPQPVIARVHGIATAAGCQLVAACDLAVAAETARFAVSGINVGLFCSTPSVALARNVGRKQAMEMLMTGELIDARAARERGLVNRVVAPEALDDEVAKLAAAIVAKSPVAVRLGKRLFYEQVERGVAEAYELATTAMTCNMMTDDAREGLDAFIQKRPPRWRGR